MVEDEVILPEKIKTGECLDLGWVLRNIWEKSLQKDLEMMTLEELERKYRVSKTRLGYILAEMKNRGS